MNPYIGEIRAFAGDRAPRGWHLCDGTLLPINENGTLFELFGTRFGGDGLSNFGLPDLRSRVPIGRSNKYHVGDKGGQEQVTLTVDNLPKHRHAPVASGQNTAELPDATGGVWSALSVNGRRYAQPPADENVALHADSVLPTGGGLPHENRMPVLAISYIVATEGLWPARD